MSFSTVRSGAAIVGAAIALAACGGRAMVPSQSTPGFNAVAPMSTNPCYTKAVQPAWIFKGSCVITTLPAKGKTIKLAPYKGVTVAVKLGKNTSQKGTFVLVDALGGKAHDITKFKRKTFPAITPTALKSVVYVEAVNGTDGLKFSGKLVFTIQAKKFPGKTCPLSVLEGTFPKLKWFNSPFTGKITGGTMVFTVPGSALGTLFPNGLPQGPLYFNVACK